MCAFATDLIRIPSENPPGTSYEDCVARIEAECDALDLVTRRLLGGLIVESSYGDGARLLYLSGHYDVVPAQSPALFAPRVVDARLVGRGSGDMKGGIAAMLYGVAALAGTGTPINGRVALRCVPDEETGGQRGSAALAAAGLIDETAIGMLTAEPTNREIWNGSRGAISWRIVTHGRAAHVGLMHQGVNAFDAMLVVIDELRALRDEIQRRDSLLLIGGRIDGGTNFNVVPDRCTMTIDRRTNPDESLDAERDALTACIDRARERGVAVSIEVLQEGSPSSTSRDSPLARALCDAVRSLGCAQPRFTCCPGLLETRFYSALNIPALAYGPGELELAHGPHESVALDAMIDCARTYARTIVRLFNV